MAAKSKDYKQPSRAELQAMRDSKLQGVAVSEAVRREISFLRNIGGAGDDLEWILFNQAWTELGFERIGDWWEQRVLPVLVHVDLRPSAALAERVIAAISADEAALPKAQRRTQREIASIARTSQSKVSRSRSDARESGSDLEGGAKADASGLVDALRGEIEDVAEKQAATADSGDTEAASDDANASADAEHNDASLSGAGSAAGPAGDRSADGSGNPPTDHRGTADPGKADDAARPSAPSAPPVVPGAGGQASDAGAERLPSLPPPADEADQGQAPEGVPAPVPPHLFADPPAFLKWFADLFEQVDVDAVGPLLVGDDFELLGDSLERIRTVIDQLADWRTRTQR